MASQARALASNIETAMDDAFNQVLADGIGKYDEMFRSLNARLTDVEKENGLLKEQVGRLERERDAEATQRHTEVDAIRKAMDGRHGVLEQKMEEVEWRVQQKLEAKMQALQQGLTDAQADAQAQKQKDLCRRVVFRMQMQAVAAAFGAFKQVWEEKRAKEAAMRKAASMMFRSTMTKCFVAWRNDAVGERKQQAAKSMEANYKRIGEIEEAMVLEVEQRHHEIAQVSTVLKQLEELIDSKNKAEADARHAEIERKIRRTVYKMKMGGVASCFEGWREVFAEKKRTDALLRKIVNSFRMKGVTMCFGAWKKDWELKKDADAVGRREADAAKNFDRIRQIEEKMEMQDEAMHAILEEKVLDLEAKSEMRLEMRLEAMKKGLDEKEEREQEAKALAMARKIMTRMLQQGLVMTFEAWSGLVEEKKEQQRMARKALSFFLNKGLAMCYHAWQGWARQERQRKIDEGKARASASVQDNYDRLEKIEPQLKEYEEALQAETEQRHYEAEQVKNVLQHLEKLLGDSFAGIQDNMAARREHMKQSGARAAIYRIKRNKIGAAFEAWQQGADAQKVEKMEEEAAKAKAKEEEKAKAKAKARREHIMAKIVYKMEGNRKGSAFTAWKGQWVRAKEAEAKAAAEEQARLAEEQVRLLNIPELSQKVHDHDQKFMQLAKTFRLIPDRAGLEIASPSKGTPGR